MTRLSLALLCLLALTAFAPAPLPRRERGGEPPDSVSQAALQGRWKVARMAVTLPAGGLSDFDWVIDAVRIRDKEWHYLTKEAVRSSTPFTVVAARGVTAIDWYWSQQKNGREGVAMVGLIRRDGGTVRVLYKPHTGPQDRPTSFDHPPDGWYLLTLTRER
jgi:uncharacterized protein (TIGR03067 family)